MDFLEKRKQKVHTMLVEIIDKKKYEVMTDWDKELYSREFSKWLKEDEADESV